MFENAESFRFNEEGFDGSAERFEGGFPVDFVADEASSIGVFKRVAVMPEAIGSKALFVYEGAAFFDGFDLGDPRDGKEGGELNTVDDDGSRIDGAVGAAGGGESEVVGGDFVEIEGMGEEFPRLGSGDGEKLLLDDVLHAKECVRFYRMQRLPLFL